MSSIRAIVLAASVMSTSATVSWAEEITLMFAGASVATSATSTQFFKPWSDRLNEAGKGSLHIDFRPGLTIANTNTSLDRVLNDVVQIAWAGQSVYGSKFKLTSVSFLPFIADTSAPAASALWRLYETGLLDADYTETVPLIFGMQSQGRLHVANATQNITDLTGLRVITIGKNTGNIVERLGGAPITLSVVDMYQALARRAVDGVLIGWGGFGHYKLAEVTRYHVELPFGMGSSMIFMERRRYHALPATVRSLLDAHGGELESRKYGQIIDDEADAERSAALAKEGHTIIRATPEQVASVRRVLAPITQEWVKTTPNGAAILETWLRLLAEVKAKN